MNLQVIKNRIKKTLAYAITSILFLLISAFLVLQMPPVQNRLVRYYLKDFSEVMGFRTSIRNFRMLWFDRLELEGVNVYDSEGNRMIGAKEIMVNFSLTQLLQGGDVNIDGIFLDSAHVLVTFIPESDTSRDLNINVFINRINDNFGGSGGTGRTPRVNIGEAFINQSQFTYIDQERDTIESGFNYNQFSLAIDEGQLKSFVVLGDTTEFQVRTLIAEDKDTHFRVKQLSTFFRLSAQAMEFYGLQLQAGESTLSDTIVMRFESQADLSDFVEKVKVKAHFNQSTLTPADLALFIPGADVLQQPLTLNGDFNGRINKFRFTNMEVTSGNTLLRGSLDMDGLPEINETFIILNLKDSRLDPNDLAFVLDENTIAQLRPMGRVSMDGQFLGYPTDFVANGNFSGKLGAIRSDINFKVNEDDIDLSTYSGRLSLLNFDLGRYMNDTAMFQRITMNGKIRGAGLSQKTADFQLNGIISSLGINRYNYRNVTTDARFAYGLVRGAVEINDPNLEFKARGSVDLREGRNLIKVQAQLDTAFLQALNLSPDPLFIHAHVDADLQGLDLDSVKGIANFNDLRVQYRDQSLALDEFKLHSQHSPQQRTLQLESTLIDATVKGNYSMKSLVYDIQVLSHEMGLNIRNDQQALRTYYQNKTYKPKSYEAQVAINLKNIKPLTRLLKLDLSLTPNTRVEGRFTSGYTSIFNAYTRFDTLRYGGSTLIDTEAEITASKIADSTSVLAMATVNSAHQVFNDNLRTKNLLLESIWNKSHIDFSLDADQDGQNNYVRLKGAVEFKQDSTVIAMEPSMLKLLEREWHFSGQNYIAFDGRDWRFHHLTLLNEDQSIDVHGRLSHQAEEKLNMRVDNLNLSVFNVLSQQKFAGVMHADVILQDFFHRPFFENNLSVRGMSINDFLVGDITGVNQWDTVANHFNINLFIDRNNARIVDVTGDYTPSDQDSPLNIVAQLDKANLKMAEPFLVDIFSRIGGTITGKFTVKGRPEAPLLEGEGVVSDGQMMVDYLRTMYRFTGKIGLTPTSVYFKDIDITDAFRNKGKLAGTISHRNFADMIIAINADFKNFQVLNTSIKDNSLFYGQAYATGTLSFYGPPSNLRISSTARTEKNTRIYIPINESSTVDKKEFITFVKFNDTTVTQTIKRDIKNKVDLTGLSFDLNLDVTPDAYCEIIFDIKAGDIIRGRGNGDLKLQLDTKGDFTMFGPFEFTQGWYNFTLYDIINKEFEIQKGSRITWYGDPYEGILNINATYNQMASLAPIVNEPDLANSTQLKRKYPVQVWLKLESQMLSPTISFDIIAKDLPKNLQADTYNNNQSTGSRNVNLDLLFTAFRNKLDDQELYRQVFSLIVLRRFSPPESFNTSGSVVNSVSELLSNQLSYWMSQVDQNLVIDVDLGVMDEAAFNTFQLRFSYTMLNGRLRITGDGTFNSATGAQNPNTQTSNPSSVAGDWTVDYMLTADGKLRVKMYSRTNVNPILSSVNNQNTLTTGASLIHTQSFNEIRDLWRRTRRRREDQSKKETNKGDARKEDEEGTE